MATPKPEPAIPQGCPLDRLFRMLSGEWTIHILWLLSTRGPARHGEIRRHIDGISAKVLTDRLRMLEAEGIVYRHYEPTVPPKVTYGLTERGHDLDKALRKLHDVAGACDWLHGGRDAGAPPQA